MRLVTIWCWILLTEGSALAQEQVWRSPGVADQVRRGIAMRAMGDVDGDGWEDLVEAVSVRTTAGTYCCSSPATAVTSGRTGAIISVAPPLGSTAVESFFRSSLTAVGDMDGDGVPDYAYSRHDALLAVTQDVVIRSGSDHHIIWMQSRPFGSSYGVHIAGNIDIDGDSRGDVITIDPRAGSGGTVFAFGNQGQLLYQIVNSNPALGIGNDVAALGGDIDNDGCDEYLVACTEPTYRGAILVVSGRTGSIIRTCYGQLPGDTLSYVTGCGDLDGDGVPDFAAGAYDLGNDCVTMFSGGTGQVIRSFRSRSVSMQGCGAMGPFVESKDLDHDGYGDVMVSAGCFLFALSGRTGDEMFRVVGSGWPAPGGTSTGMGWFTLLDPPMGEQYPILVYGESAWWSAQNWGIMFHPGLTWGLRTSPPTVSTFGIDNSSAPQTARMGMRDLAGAVTRFTLSSAPPAAVGFFLLGWSNQAALGTTLPAALAPFGFPGATLQVSPDAVLLALAGSSGVNSGYVQLDLPLDLLPTGMQVYAQWIWFDPADLSQHGSTVGHAFRAR